MAVGVGKNVSMVSWDVAKLFDSIDIARLYDEVKATDAIEWRCFGGSCNTCFWRFPGTFLDLSVAFERREHSEPLEQ